MLPLRVAAGQGKPEAEPDDHRGIPTCRLSPPSKMQIGNPLQTLEFQLQIIEAVLRVKMRQQARGSAYTTLPTSSRSRAINQRDSVEQLRSDTGVSHAGRPVPGIVDDMILNGQFERG